MPMHCTSSWNSIEIFSLASSSSSKKRKIESKRPFVLLCSREYVQAIFLTCISSAWKITCQIFWWYILNSKDNNHKMNGAWQYTCITAPHMHLQTWTQLLQGGKPTLLPRHHWYLSFSSFISANWWLRI